jgi:hypothetical protein
MTAASRLVVVDRSDHEGDVEFWFILRRDDADVLPALDFSRLPGPLPLGSIQARCCLHLA